MHRAQPPHTPTARNVYADGGPGEGQGRVVKVTEGLSHLHHMECRSLEGSVPRAPQGKGLACYEASPQRPDSDHRQEGLGWTSEALGLEHHGEAATVGSEPNDAHAPQGLHL